MSTDRSDSVYTFDKQKGEDFLCTEIGLSVLPPEGSEIAQLLGFDKFALIVIGDMISPTKKEKRKWSWKETIQYVMEIHSELIRDQ